MDDKFLIQTERKYVIATLDEHTYYMRKSVGANSYQFLDNVAGATKANTEKMAQQILKYYRYDSGSTEPLVIVPIDITYELVDTTGTLDNKEVVYG